MSFPSDQTSPEQIEDIMSMLSEMGNATEADDEGEEDDKDDDDRQRARRGHLEGRHRGQEIRAGRAHRRSRAHVPAARWAPSNCCPANVAIAKRIEAGCGEGPLTFQAIIIWRDELNEGKIFLRDTT